MSSSLSSFLPKTRMIEVNKPRAIPETQGVAELVLVAIVLHVGRF